MELVLVSQLCLTLCDPMDCSLPNSSVHGILQPVILPFPSPWDLPNPGIKPGSPTLQVDSFFFLIKKIFFISLLSELLGKLR